MNSTTATSHVAQLACEDTFGAGATPRLALYRERWLAWVEELVGPPGGDSSTWAWTVHALASGATTGEAWGALVRLCYRADRTLTTRETADALGIVPSTVRHAIRNGRLSPLTRGKAPRTAARFSPTDVLRRAGLLRDSGLGESAPGEPPETAAGEEQ